MVLVVFTAVLNFSALKIGSSVRSNCFVCSKGFLSQERALSYGEAELGSGCLVPAVFCALK